MSRAMEDILLNSHERNIIVIAHRARTDPDFHLNDLCGSAGRLDGVLRCINSALFLSHGMRRDTAIHVLLLGEADPPKVLSISGRNVKYLNPDERSTASLVRKALEIPLPKDRVASIRSTPGIAITRMDLKGMIGTIDGPLFVLDEDGSDISQALEGNDIMKADRRSYFLFSDDQDLTEDEKRMLEEKGAARISLSPSVLHADHAITVLHNFLDRRYGPSPKDVSSTMDNVF